MPEESAKEITATSEREESFEQLAYWLQRKAQRNHFALSAIFLLFLERQIAATISTLTASCSNYVSFHNTYQDSITSLACVSLFNSVLASLYIVICKAAIFKQSKSFISFSISAILLSLLSFIYSAYYSYRSIKFGSVDFKPEGCDINLNDFEFNEKNTLCLANDYPLMPEVYIGNISYTIANRTSYYDALCAPNLLKIAEEQDDFLTRLKRNPLRLIFLLTIYLLTYIHYKTRVHLNNDGAINLIRRLALLNPKQHALVLQNIIRSRSKAKRAIAWALHHRLNLLRATTLLLLGSKATASFAVPVAISIVFAVIFLGLIIVEPCYKEQSIDIIRKSVRKLLLVQHTGYSNLWQYATNIFPTENEILNFERALTTNIKKTLYSNMIIIVSLMFLFITSLAYAFQDDQENVSLFFAITFICFMLYASFLSDFSEHSAPIDLLDKAYQEVKGYRGLFLHSNHQGSKSEPKEMTTVNPLAAAVREPSSTA